MKHLLIVSPSAPPKNSPESFQLDRILGALDPNIFVTLITTPLVNGWEKHDHSLDRERSNFRVLMAKLPGHNYTAKILTNHRLRRLHVPDSDFWISYTARRLTKILTAAAPDAIYSRSFPFSSAVLAQRLSKSLDIPWMMHLSDPWFESPYRHVSPKQRRKDRALEERCFLDAQRIALTTDGQAAYYRRRYPTLAPKISVTPNIMPKGLPAPQKRSVVRKGDAPIRLVYTGAFYGQRSPAPLLAAAAKAASLSPELSSGLNIDFFGNATPEIINLIEGSPFANYGGAVSHDEAIAAQQSADVLLVLEPDMGHELQTHFLPSKVLDYMHSGKPIFAITPEGSETYRLCQSGAGWSFAPNNLAGIAAALSQMVTYGAEFTAPPSSTHDFRLAFSPTTVVPKLQALLTEMVSKQATFD